MKYDTIQKYGNDDPMNLSNSELHRIVKESVNRVIKENSEERQYKGCFIYYEPRTQEEWTDTEVCFADNIEQAKEIFKQRHSNLLWVVSEDGKEHWHIKDDNPKWVSQTERLYNLRNNIH
jgi:hypothetical protein